MFRGRVESSVAVRVLWVLLLLLLLPGAAAFAEGDGDERRSMSPVGVWHFQIFHDGEEAFTAYHVLHRDGTTVTTPSVLVDQTFYGEWKKVNGHDYVMTYYAALVDEATGVQTGNLELIQRFTLDDRNHLHGRSELFLFAGEPIRSSPTASFRCPATRPSKAGGFLR